MTAARRLLIFGKLPAPGRTKTRLAPALGFEGAAALYAAFLDDAVAVAGELVGTPTELWVEPSQGARVTLTSRYPGLPLRLQSGGDLGTRLSHAFETSFGEGADHVVIVGSDHPTLPSQLLERAFRALVGGHLVLGPTEDGGYYCVGLRRNAWPGAASLFEGVPWSTGEALAVTIRNAERLGLCRVELPVWYDVDEPDALGRLARDVRPGTATSIFLERSAREAGAVES